MFRIFIFVGTLLVLLLFLFLLPLLPILWFTSWQVYVAIHGALDMPVSRNVLGLPCFFTRTRATCNFIVRRCEFITQRSDASLGWYGGLFVGLSV